MFDVVIFMDASLRNLAHSMFLWDVLRVGFDQNVYSIETGNTYNPTEFQNVCRSCTVEELNICPLNSSIYILITGYRCTWSYSYIEN